MHWAAIRYSRLLDRYGSKLDFKYTWIDSTATILSLFGLLTGLLWTVLAFCGHLFIKSQTVLLSLTIILNILWQYSLKIGLIVSACYLMWHIVLQIYKGTVRLIWIVIMSIFSFILLLVSPNFYSSEIGHLNYSNSFYVANDINYLGKLMSHSDKAKTLTLTLRSGDVQKCKMMKIEYNLYECIDISSVGKMWDPKGHLILSHDDGERLYNNLKWSGESEVSFTYNANTRIVTDYQVLGKSEDNDKSSETSDLLQGIFPEKPPENIPETVEIWFEIDEIDGIEVPMIKRPEIPDYDGVLYWYIVRNGELYDCSPSATHQTFTSFLNHAEKGGYTITLVIDYDKKTDTYKTISNTIDYFVE